MRNSAEEPGECANAGNRETCVSSARGTPWQKGANRARVRGGESRVALCPAAPGKITVLSSGRGRGHGCYASGSALCCCGEPMGKGRKARIAPWVPDRGPVHGVHARKPVEDRQQRSAEQEKGAWCAPIDAVVAGRPRAQRWKRAAEQYAGCEGGVSEIARPPVITGQTKTR